ncbi:drs2 neo1 protein, partial [Cryomyces antarcticus]
MVLLHSTGANGAAYIETMALDGETNLKNKQAPRSVAKSCSSLKQLAACDAHFVIEDPNIDLYSFEGRVAFAGEVSPLTNNEIIYRGSILRNTPESIGMVIYTGEECKIRMNANKNPRIKAPALQAVVNKIVVIIVIFVIVLAIFNTVAYQVWRETTEARSWYLKNAKVAFLPILTSFIIMFNTMIPLSLYVSLEIIKLCQMLLLNDIDMYDEVSNTPFEARTSTINEELGQISYIFSDKTGTLTDNSMKFRKLSVAGTAWLHDNDLKAGMEREAQRLLHKNGNKKSKGKRPLGHGRKPESQNTSIHPELDGSIDDALISYENTTRKPTSNWTS